MYKVLVQYRGDTIRTHGWIAGISVPRIEPVWRVVTGEQLEIIKSHSMFDVFEVIELRGRADEEDRTVLLGESTDPQVHGAGVSKRRRKRRASGR
ncbi:MAG: hypothetical protein KatS3mg087_0440 [Patescibacteria group bacterium]|nr:MAG: hypothetical protein KatS3mg087_0440 [Patescibacteria group bacterium]